MLSSRIDKCSLPCCSWFFVGGAACSCVVVGVVLSRCGRWVTSPSWGHFLWHEFENLTLIIFILIIWYLIIFLFVVMGQLKSPICLLVLQFGARASSFVLHAWWLAHQARNHSFNENSRQSCCCAYTLESHISFSWCLARSADPHAPCIPLSTFGN